MAAEPAGSFIPAGPLRLRLLPNPANAGQIRNRRSGRFPAPVEIQMVCFKDAGQLLCGPFRGSCRLQKTSHLHAS